MSPHSSEAGADSVKASAESSDSHRPHHGAKLLSESEGLRKSVDKEFQSTNPGDMMTLASNTVRSVWEGEQRPEHVVFLGCTAQGIPRSCPGGRS